MLWRGRYEDDDVDEIEDEDEGDASTLLDDGDAQGEALFDDADDVDDDDDDESDESDDGNSDSEGAGQKRAHGTIQPTTLSRHSSLVFPCSRVYSVTIASFSLAAPVTSTPTKLVADTHHGVPSRRRWTRR